MDEREIIERIRAVIREADDGKIGPEERKRIRAKRPEQWVCYCIAGLARGYDQRKKDIKGAELKPWVSREYQRINDAIDKGMAEACDGYAKSVTEQMKRDICDGRGYRFSILTTMFSERAYYRLKRSCVVMIAWYLGIL